MARVSLSKTYADGECIDVTVVVKESYPDAVAEAQVNANRAFREALHDNLATWSTDAEEED